MEPPSKDRPSGGAGQRPAFIRRGTSWSEVTQLNETTFRVRLGGLLKPAWMTALCNRLADAHISIDHTHARRAHDNSWIAELHLLTLGEAPNPLQLPYLDWSDADDAPSSALPRLDAYRLLESRDYGGTLALTLEAADTLGLLGSLMALLSKLSLYPVEVHIETHGGRAYDSLWLTSANGAAPGADVKAALEQALDGLVAQ
jgi:hypothetical protein